MTRKELFETVPSGWVLIEDRDDWTWYCARLDVAQRYQHRHVGEPTAYPCIAYSIWEDDPNGPYKYHHSFRGIAEDSVGCDHCGQVTKNYSWGEVK